MFNLPFFDKKSINNTGNSTVVKEIQYNGIVWLDIIKPTSKEIEALGKKFDFHELVIEDCMTEHQRSKIDDFDDYSFIVIHLPRYKKELLRIDSEEVDIFIGKDYLITLHDGELKPLTELSQKCEENETVRHEFMENGSALLLYEIIKVLFDYCFPMLDKIGITLDTISKEIFNNRSKEMLENIARMKMQIITYLMVIKPLRPVVLQLERIIVKYLPKNHDDDDDKYYDDITDKIEKIWNMLENYKEVIEASDDTFASLTNHRINNLMKIFTIIQVVILPMTLVGGLFSMNVNGIPMHSFKGAFWIVFGMIMVPTTIIILSLIMKRDKWL